MVEAGDVEPEYLAEVYEGLEEQARSQLAEADVPPADMAIQRWADCRYTGQAYELLVPVEGGSLDRKALAALEETFHERHEREYFWRFTSEKPVQIVHVRVYGIGAMPELSLRKIEAGAADPIDEARTARAGVGFFVDDEVATLEADFYAAEHLRAGNVITGPAIVEHDDSTTVINPGLTASVDDYGTLVIDCGGGDG